MPRQAGVRGRERWKRLKLLEENKMILLFKGRRGAFFFSFFFSCRCKVLLRLSCEFSVELHHLLRTRQLGASGALGSRSVFCQLSVMKKEKQLRELSWGGHHRSLKFQESSDGWTTRKNKNNYTRE